jgi:hypothetical protein
MDDVNGETILSNVYSYQLTNSTLPKYDLGIIFVDKMGSNVAKPLSNGAFRAGEKLPNEATIIRGGESKPADLKANQAKDTSGNTLSANGGVGVTDKTLSNGMPQNSITKCTVGDLRAKGYDVVATPRKDNAFHVSIITPQARYFLILKQLTCQVHL